MKTKNILFFLIPMSFLTGCIISAGTHGSLKNYEFMVTKYELDSVVDLVIKNNPNISQEAANVNYIVDVTDGKNDTIIDDYYNDGINYLTIKIKNDPDLIEYTFRYLGDSTDWNANVTSEIFICYAYDQNGNGGSEGNGGVSNKQLHYFTEIFEREFITKIDSILGKPHLDPK